MPEPFEHCLPKARTSPAGRAKGCRSARSTKRLQGAAQPVSSRSPRIDILAYVRAMRFDRGQLGIGQNKTIIESSFGELKIGISNSSGIPKSQRALVLLSTKPRFSGLQSFANRFMKAIMHWYGMVDMDRLALEESGSRFAAFCQEFDEVIGHRDRTGPFHSYCAGLLPLRRRVSSH